MSINPAAFIAMKEAGKLWKRKCGTAKRTRLLGTIKPSATTDKLVTATKSGKKVNCAFAKGIEKAKAVKKTRVISEVNAKFTKKGIRTRKLKKSLVRKKTR